MTTSLLDDFSPDELVDLGAPDCSAPPGQYVCVDEDLQLWVPLNLVLDRVAARARVPAAKVLDAAVPADHPGREEALARVTTIISEAICADLTAPKQAHDGTKH